MIWIGSGPPQSLTSYLPLLSRTGAALPSWLLPFALHVLDDQSSAWLDLTAVRPVGSATCQALPVGVRLFIVTDGGLTVPHALQVLGIGKVGGLQVDAVVLLGSLQRLVPLPT